MATNWIIPTGNSIAKVLTALVRQKANQNIDPDVKDTDAFDPDMPNRADAIVAMVVARVRGGIQHANRFPLSVTLGAIPPESEQIVLNYAAYSLVTATPNLQSAIMENMKDLLAKWRDVGEKYFEDLKNGLSVVYPSDPTGQDYLTAESATNPAPNLIGWSSLYWTDAEFAQGYTIDPTTGAQTPLVNTNMVIY